MFTKLFADKNTLKDKGLLLLRIGIGISFIVHGFPKIAGGTEKWAMLGKAMGNVGLDFGNVFWWRNVWMIWFFR